MLVPPVFGQSWINEEKIVHLNSYYIKFCPCPNDRDYKKFGLFIMAPLPPEAEKLELDLHLAHSRYVKTKVIPFGVLEFHKDEVNNFWFWKIKWKFKLMLGRLHTAD